MKRGISPSEDLRTPRKIATEIARDIASVRSYVGASGEFYRAMQERAMKYEGEIEQHFGYQLFPEGTYAPITIAEWRKGDWKPLMHRASAQLELMWMAMKLHRIAFDGWLKTELVKR